MKRTAPPRQGPLRDSAVVRKNRFFVLWGRMASGAAVGNRRATRLPVGSQVAFGQPAPRSVFPPTIILRTQLPPRPFFSAPPAPPRQRVPAPFSTVSLRNFGPRQTRQLLLTDRVYDVL